MELPKPMTHEEAAQVRYRARQAWPKGEPYAGDLEDVWAWNVAQEQHRCDVARFVALLRKRAKVPRGFADGFIDAYSLADELEQSQKEARMKAEALLLTHEEYRDVIIQGGKITTGVRDYNIAAILCRAQAAKALAYLIALAKYSGECCGTEYVSAGALSRIIADTGLTWPYSIR